MSNQADSAPQVRQPLLTRDAVLARVASREITPQEACWLLDAAEQAVNQNTRHTSASLSTDEAARMHAMAAFREAFGLPDSPGPLSAFSFNLEVRALLHRRQIESGRQSRDDRRSRSSPSPPTLETSSASTANKQVGAAIRRTGSLGEEVSYNETDSIIRALDKAGEPLGMRLLSVKSGISERRLLKIVPQLVTNGVLKPLGTGRNVRCAKADS